MDSLYILMLNEKLLIKTSQEKASCLKSGNICPFRFLERIAISGADSINWIFRDLKFHFSLKTV
jgi:hypothetical protein